MHLHFQIWYLFKDEETPSAQRHQITKFRSCYFKLVPLTFETRFQLLVVSKMHIEL